MNNNSNSDSKAGSSLIPTLFFGFVLTFGLFGCSSGGSDDPPEVTHEDASGLFTGSGTVNNGTSLNGLRGFVHDNRFIFFDETEAVLYDGQIVDINESDLTATVDVYKDGVKENTTSVSVTGTVTSQSSISLTLNGERYALGTLSLTFDLLYNRGATIAKLAADSFARWVGDAHTSTTTISGNVRFLSKNDETVTAFRGDTGSPSSCFYDGFKNIPDPAINIYQVTSLDVTEAGGTCDHLGTGYTGFFAVVDGTGTDDTLLFAAANGRFSNFSVMTK